MIKPKITSFTLARPVACVLVVLMLNTAACDFIGSDDAEPAAPQLHPVLIDGFWGFINGEGRIMITPNFETVGTFSDGMAAVQFGTDWGYVNAEGDVVIQPQYQFAGDFVEGLAPVRGSGFNDQYGFIDRSGTFVIAAQYELAQAFSEGLAAVPPQRAVGLCEPPGRTGHRAPVQRCAPVLRRASRRRGS